MKGVPRPTTEGWLLIGTAAVALAFAFYTQHVWAVSYTHLTLPTILRV